MNEPVFKPRAAESNDVIDVIWHGKEGRRRIRRFADVKDGQWISDLPWEASFSVRIGRNGWVEDIFMIKPTDVKDRNTSLLRELARIRMDGVEEGETGNIDVWYRPVKQVGETPGGANP